MLIPITLVLYFVIFPDQFDATLHWLGGVILSDPLQRQTKRYLSGVAYQLSALVGENLPGLVPISLNLPSAPQRPSPQGWIRSLRAVSCTDTQTTGAQCPPLAVRLPTRGPALAPGASCVDRGSSLVMNVPSSRQFLAFMFGLGVPNR
jgi:hypothetical protein